MSKKFPFGKDTEVYIEKALEIMKDTYPWASREMFRPEYSYAIEKQDGKEVFVSYYKWEDGDINREVRDVSSDEFIDSIISDHRWSIESANPTKAIFKVPYQSPIILHGWYLERYEFRSHELGGYSSFVQAGDRTAGASREFFLPPRFFAGSWSDFLDQYCELVPGYAFGLDREQLEDINGLKSFLGFSDKISPKVWDYILAHNVDDLFLLADWNGFLDLLYTQGGWISAIRFYDHCRWEDREKSIGKDGPFDPANKSFMYLKTEVHQEGLEDRSLEEVKAVIEDVRSQYPDYDLIPAFTLVE